jgi:tripartite-type tricarboxylate transporter receptor subunit TctC
MNNFLIPSRREALKLGIVGASSLALPAFGQSDYPSRPIKIIVPLQAGGVGDNSVRSMAERLQVTLKQPIVVENKPGGVFAIAMQAMAAAPADGYTLLHINVGMLAVQAALKRYDLLKQLAPITEANYGPTMLFASMKAPFSTVPEMIAYGRANPGKINYGSLGPGSLEHLLGHSVAKAGGFEATHVPYKGGPDAAMSLLQGDTHLLSSILQLGKQFVEKGQMRSLGVFADQRLAILPDLPTVKQLGLDAPNMTYWGGFATHAGVPATIIETLRREIGAALNFPAVRERTEAGGTFTSFSGSSAEFVKKINYDLDWMGNAVKSANLNLS